MYRFCILRLLLALLCLNARVLAQQGQQPRLNQSPNQQLNQAPNQQPNQGLNQQPNQLLNQQPNQLANQQPNPNQGSQGNQANLVCPRPTTPPGPCTVGCQNDRNCQQGLRCCDTGCGRECRRPIPRGPQPGPPGQRLPNGSPRQGQPQQLPPQPSLVGLGGCSRGATLRNPDGSTLVCGFGPRDFACPVDFSCVFDSILRALVCCPSEDATPPPTPSPPNPCPDGEPLRDEFNNNLQCSITGPSGLSTCPTGTLCTSGVCCRPQSVAGFLSVKPGQCPLPLPIAQNSPCNNECTFDAECPGALKCCFVGCGARCIQVTSDGLASGAAPPGSAPLSPGAQSPPFDLVPTRNDGIFLQQQRQGGFGGPQSGGFLGDQQGGGFAARGPQQQQRGAPQQQFQSQAFASRAQDFASKSDSFVKPVSGILFRPGVAPVTANDTCEKAACPACHECSEATGLPRCIRMPDCCPDGSTPTACHTNPCPHTKCPDNPEAFCFPDGCSNVCRAVYYDRVGNVATCPTSSNL